MPGIIVLGMHRSGTSLITNIVRNWGTYLGPVERLIRPDRWNPLGYWEYKPMVDFNRELLRAVGASWFRPPREESLCALEALAGDPTYRAKALELICVMEAQPRPWVWKDPRLSILLPFWSRLWGRVLYIVAIRDPMAIAKSLARRNSFDPFATLILWHSYMLSILKAVWHYEPVTFIAYEELIIRPNETCLRLNSVLCDFFSVAKRQGLAAMISCVAPTLDHQRDVSADRIRLNPEQDALLDVLMARARGVAVDWYRTTTALPPDWHERLARLAALD